MPTDPSPRTRASSPTPETIMELGMPQLGFNGLSENWLLKECGHRHWSAICDRAGVPSHQITDPQGHRLYAAFVAIELAGDPLSRFGENDRVEFQTELHRFSNKRFFSETTLQSALGGGRSCVRMVSIFVKKPVFDDNQSIAAGHPDPLRRIEQEEPPAAATELLAEWKAAKSSAAKEHLDSPTYDHRICPTTDFNGARLLYFANFQHILDRAEWGSLDTADMQFASTQRRRFLFFGNVNYGDVLTVRFSDVGWTGPTRRHHATIRRRRDDGILAVIDTVKHIDPPHVHSAR